MSPGLPSDAEGVPGGSSEDGVCNGVLLNPRMTGSVSISIALAVPCTADTSSASESSRLSASGVSGNSLVRDRFAVQRRQGESEGFYIFFFGRKIQGLRGCVRSFSLLNWAK